MWRYPRHVVWRIPCTKLCNSNDISGGHKGQKQRRDKNREQGRLLCAVHSFKAKDIGAQNSSCMPWYYLWRITASAMPAVVRWSIVYREWLWGLLWVESVCVWRQVMMWVCVWVLLVCVFVWVCCVSVCVTCPGERQPLLHYVDHSQHKALLLRHNLCCTWETDTDEWREVRERQEKP